MDTTGVESGARVGEDPDVIKYTTDYVRRLLAEAVYIYASIENQGGSVILTQSGLVDSDRTFEYSSQIGNPFHLDLIELQQLIDEVCSKGERDALLEWANGLSQQQAAIYLQSTGAVKVKGATLRKRRERGVKSLTEKLNEEANTGEIGKDSKLPVDESREGATRYWPPSTTWKRVEEARNPE